MSTPARTPFNIKLSAEEKARLEEHRIAMGLRSHAEVIRIWIADSPEAVSVSVPNLVRDLNRSAGTAFRGAFGPETKSTSDMGGERIGPADVRRYAVMDIAALHADRCKKIAAEPGGRTIPGVQYGPTPVKAGDLAKKPKK